MFFLDRFKERNFNISKAWGSTSAADFSKHCLKCQLHSAHMLYSSSWAVVTEHECKQKTNSVTTEVKIKFIREMSPSNAWQFEVKKHMKIPCSCALFPRSTIYCIFIIFQQIKHVWLAACWLRLASVLDLFIYLFVVIFTVRLARSAGEGKWKQP